jgi:hypothetical protein
MVELHEGAMNEQAGGCDLLAAEGMAVKLLLCRFMQVALLSHSFPPQLALTALKEGKRGGGHGGLLTNCERLEMEVHNQQLLAANWL